MAKVRYLTMERKQDNPVMQLPIEPSFISRFVVEPLCYTRSATFAGIVELHRVPYSCRIAAGFLHGEEIMRRDFADQRSFTIPITPVGRAAECAPVDRCVVVLGHDGAHAQRSPILLNLQSRLRARGTVCEGFIYVEYLDSSFAATYRGHTYAGRCWPILFHVDRSCLGAWQSTHEHVPSARRYSYQPLATSSSATNLTRKPTLRTKARSMGV